MRADTVSSGRRRQGRWVRALGWIMLGMAPVLYGLHVLAPDPSATKFRYEVLEAHLDQPYRASEIFETRIQPALHAAIIGDEFDGNQITFMADSFVGNPDQNGGPGSPTPNAVSRDFLLRAYGSTGAEYAATWFEWDDAVIASLDSSGRKVTDREVLVSLYESDFAAELRAVEERTEQRARHDLTWLRWQRGYLIAADSWFPVVGLLLLLIGPFVLVAAMAFGERTQVDRRHLAEAQDEALVGA